MYNKERVMVKFYELLDGEVCFSEICSKADFEQYFEHVFKDFVLVSKDKT